jgi:hypothetical protein
MKIASWQAGFEIEQTTSVSLHNTSHENSLNTKYRSQPRRRKKCEPLWAKCFYSDKMEECMIRAVKGAQATGGVTFDVMARRPGAQGRTLTFVLTDAAGCRRVHLANGGIRELPLREQGEAGAWVVFVDPDRRLDRAGPIQLRDCRTTKAERFLPFWIPHKCLAARLQSSFRILVTSALSAKLHRCRNCSQPRLMRAFILVRRA